MLGGGVARARARAGGTVDLGRSGSRPEPGEPPDAAFDQRAGILPGVRGGRGGRSAAGMESVARRSRRRGSGGAAPPVRGDDSRAGPARADAGRSALRAPRGWQPVPGGDGARARAPQWWLSVAIRWRAGTIVESRASAFW